MMLLLWSLLCTFLHIVWAKRKLASTSTLHENEDTNHYDNILKSHHDHRSLLLVNEFNHTIYDYKASNITKNSSSLRSLTNSHHKVNSLPGLDPSIHLNHFAGHLPVNKEGSGQLFYWLFEAEVDPDTGS